MRFLHISGEDGKGSQTLQAEYLAKACAALGVEYVRIIDLKCTLAEFRALSDTSGDVVYRSGLSQKAHDIEKALVQETTRTNFYDPNLVFTGKVASTDILKRHRLPYIPDVPFLPVNKRDALEFAPQLGGFPLVIKVMGGMEGVGVIRVDSIESFNSVSDYLKAQPKVKARVMQYIPHTYFARLVVVGGVVVAATRDMAPLGDFRANARGPRDDNGSVFVPSDEMVRDAVTFVERIGVKSAGVDILLNDDAYYFAEANSPFNFVETQKRTGVDIAQKIVQQLCL